MTDLFHYRNLRHRPLVTLNDYEEDYGGTRPLVHYRYTLLSMSDWSSLEVVGAIERPCLQVYVWDGTDELTVFDIRVEEIM